MEPETKQQPLRVTLRQIQRANRYYRIKMVGLFLDAVFSGAMAVYLALLAIAVLTGRLEITAVLK